MFNSVAIMQPTYLPWLGYLAMINRVKNFVFLDIVQFDKRSWQQRNRIKNANDELWLTLSVLSKNKFHQKINEVVCQDLKKTVKKHLATIQHSYKKAPEYENFYPFFENVMWEAYKASNASLSIFNTSIIENLCIYAKLNYKFTLASNLDCAGEKDELLSNICDFFQSKEYVSPIGSKVYLENSRYFKEKQINILYQNYIEPEYQQLNSSHIKNLSCLDAFFCIPREELKAFIMSGVR